MVILRLIKESELEIEDKISEIEFYPEDHSGTYLNPFTEFNLT